MLHLDGPILSNQLVLHLIAPQSSLREIFQQMRIHYLWEKWKNTQKTFVLRRHDAYTVVCSIHADLKLSRKHPAGVDVAGVGLNGLVVTQDLSSGSCRHGGQEQTVPYTMPEDTKGERVKELNQG